MKISYNWLKDYIKTDLTAEKTADLLTNAGLEVEEIHTVESVRGGLEGLVIGQVKTVDKHPDADKLKVTTVDIGKAEPLQIVCGAPNVAVGQKVVVALAATTIYPILGEPVKIKNSKIRGVESFGMICAQDEIGLGTDHAGIIVLPENVNVAVGSLAKDFYKIESDFVFDIGLTPNRSDAMSHIGVARDLCAVLKVRENITSEVVVPSVENFNNDDESLVIDVSVDDAKACTRYSGITISEITIATSPQWLQNKLKAIGLRPLNNVVDITNYVMHECGQPLHAFDANEITGNKVIVKFLPAGAEFQTLDEQKRKLDAADLMICNAKESMCIAGVFGGIHSGVKDSTKNVFLESATFNPSYVRRTSFRHNLRTEAAIRFEKGTDPNGTEWALKRAALLIKEICGGKISSDVIDFYPKPVLPKEIELFYKQLNTLSGTSIPAESVKTILTSLDYDILTDEAHHLLVSVPTSKNDIQRPESVIEEILRIYGYDKIPTMQVMKRSVQSTQPNPIDTLFEVFSEYLSANGFSETISNSITNGSRLESVFGCEPSQVIKLVGYKNVGLDTLRPTLISSGLEAISYNSNRQNADLKFFEFGKVFQKNGDENNEKFQLGLFVTGKKNEKNWIAKDEQTDFYYLKTFVINLLKRCGIKGLQTQPVNDSSFDYAIQLLLGKREIATLGLLSRKIGSGYDVKQPVFYACLQMEEVVILSAKNSIKFNEIPVFPSVERDLAIVINKEVTYDKLEALVKKQAGQLLKYVNIFDIYEDEKIGKGKKSCALSFTFLDKTKTLTDKDIENVMSRLIETFKKELSAEIRN
jgi:phenylalanyl-tRNA synthetase beta chain